MVIGEGDRPTSKHSDGAAASSRKILAGSVGTGTLMAVHAVLGIATAMVFARLMGPEGYGIYSFGLAVATLLTIPTKNGLSGLIVREVARAFGAEDWSRLQGVMRWAWVVTLAYSAALAGAVAAGCLLLAPDVPIAQATALSMLLVPVWSLLGNVSGGVRGLARPVIGLMSDSAIRPLLHLGLVAGATYGLGMAVTADLAMWTQIAATAAAALWLMATFRALLPVEAKATRARSVAWREWTRAALPFAAIGGLQIAARQADLIILGIMTDERQVGLYRVAIQGSMLITFGSQAVNIVVAPHFARYRPGNTRGDVWALMRTSVLFSLAVALPGVVVFALYGEELITLVFGANFVDGALPLTILSAANAVAMLNGAVVPLLNMTGNERETLSVFFSAVVSNLILNVLFVPLFGMQGAAAAALLSTILWSYLLRRASVRRLGVDPLLTALHNHPVLPPALPQGFSPHGRHAAAEQSDGFDERERKC